MAIALSAASCAPNELSTAFPQAGPSQYRVPQTLQEDPSNKVYGNVSVDVLSGDIYLRFVPYNDLEIYDAAVAVTDPETGRFRKDESRRSLRVDLDLFMRNRILPLKDCERKFELTTDVVIEIPYSAMSLRTGVLTLRIKPRCLKKHD